ncbi:leucine-rich repeat protein [[Clostridium] hylemonae]|uniref:leucine-rich repeat protein n=1 Tax=[Clostridium] hylemonae TaxID=89153 RepID=UPI001FCC1FE1|nr:leucine-rich repeat protein [[Clostridium] hylemonae]BDF05834.1 hypothetical protein CE91St63_28960 [[Clostridium] hylemonae]
MENLSQNTTDKTEQSVHESEKAQMDDTVTPSRAAKAPGSTVTVDGLKYNILTMPDGGENGTVEVGVNQSYNGNNLSIPSTITVDNDPDNNGNYDVVQIVNGAFGSNQNLTGTLTIPSSVTSIGEQAFQQCSNITELHCLSTKTLTIAWFAFRGCTSLESVSFPDSLQSIEYSVFKDCGSLKSVSFPESLQSIGDSAFEGCKRLASPSFPQSLQSIGINAFKDCKALTSLSFPLALHTIGSNAFRDCKGLKSVTFQNNLQSIQEFAFSGCSGLTSLNFPESLETIGSYAFTGCNSITAFTVPDNNPNFTSENGVLYDKRMETLLIYPLGKEETSFIVPKGVQTIGASGFDNCKNLKSVSFPDSLQFIGLHAFQGCTSLESITFPQSLQSIQNYAFRGCTSLESVTFPQSLQSIQDYAFRDCTSLTNLTFKKDSPPQIGSLNFQVFASIAPTGTIYFPTGQEGKYTEDWKKNTLKLDNNWTLQPAYRLEVKNGTDNTNSGLYLEGDSVSIQADPAPAGYVFDKWTTDKSGSFTKETDPSTTFVMPADHVTVSAAYKKDTSNPGPGPGPNTGSGQNIHVYDTNSRWHDRTAGDGANSIPRTGDTETPLPWLLTMLAAFVGCVSLLLYRKHRCTKRHK